MLFEIFLRLEVSLNANYLDFKQEGRNFEQEVRNIYKIENSLRGFTTLFRGFAKGFFKIVKVSKKIVTLRVVWLQKRSILDPVHMGPDPYGHHINLTSFKTSMTLKFVIILQNLIKTYHRKSGKSKCDRKVTELDVEITRIRSGLV